MCVAMHGVRLEGTSGRWVYLPGMFFILSEPQITQIGADFLLASPWMPFLNPYALPQSGFTPKPRVAERTLGFGWSNLLSQGGALLPLGFDV